MRSAAELKIPIVTVFAEDDAESLHLHRAGESVPLKGEGVEAYLDIEQIVNAASVSAEPF